MNKKYDMNFEDSQDYIQKRGLDVPWNDCDVFIDACYEMIIKLNELNLL